MQANQPRPGIENNTNTGHVSVTKNNLPHIGVILMMDVIQGHWENENNLRNWCFFQAVKNDLNNVWMTKNNPHHPCLTKKGSTLCSEYKSSLSSPGD
jgi:hypothetical protein